MEKLDIKYYTYDELYTALKNNKKLDYHNIGIDLGGKVKLCKVLYRKQKVSNIPPQVLFIDPDSYDISRIPIVNFMIDDIIERKTKGNRILGIREEISLYIRFIDWVDNYSLVSILTIKDAHNAYNLYTSYLNMKIFSPDKMHPHSARALQSSALKLLTYIFNDQKSIINMGISNINQEKAQCAEKSNDKDIAYSLTFYYKLFHQITDFLLADKPYPFQLILPNENLWVWYGHPWIQTSHNRIKMPKMYFDYKEGRIRSKIELAKLLNTPVGEVSHNHNIMLQKLEKNNSQRTMARMQLGTVALKAFYILFITITGTNDSVAATLHWDNKFELKNKRQGFKNIKYRAQNKIVEFELRKEFIQDFYKYLKLRKYLLGEFNSDYLFFTGYLDNTYLSHKQVCGAFTSSINYYMKRRIDPNLPIINSHELRVNRTHFIINKYGISVAAKAAQSSKAMIKKHYTGESQASANKQLTDFFTTFHSKVIIPVQEGNSISIGQCLNPQYPHSNYPNKLEIEPDCKHMEGCIFCSEYRIHADKTDIRKILSFKYIILQSKYISNTIEHFKSLFSIYLKQIDKILHQIKTKYPNLKKVINNIYYDVFTNENLDPYWEYKYENLVNLGILL